MADIFVLSLEGCEARRGHLLEALAALKLTPFLVLGVDGRAGLDRAAEGLLDRQELNRRAKRLVTDGEVACALSHLAIYRAIVENKSEHAIILEDDAELADDFLETVDALKNHDFDIALLDHQFACSRWSPEFELPTGATAWRVTNIPNRNTGYMVTGKGARLLLENSFPLRFTADWPCDVSTLVTMALRPRAVIRPENEKGSVLAAERKASQARAIWGNPSPPYSDTRVSAKLRRLFSRRIR